MSAARLRPIFRYAACTCRRARGFDGDRPPVPVAGAVLLLPGAGAATAAGPTGTVLDLSFRCGAATGTGVVGVPMLVGDCLFEVASIALDGSGAGRAPAPTCAPPCAPARPAAAR